MRGGIHDEGDGKMATVPQSRVEIELQKWGTGVRSVKVNSTEIYRMTRVVIEKTIEGKAMVTLEFLTDDITYLST